jgi:methanogenic corrinoid protein MtbC1/DNA-binding XRE family transcriptional regulator
VAEFNISAGRAKTRADPKDLSRLRDEYTAALLAGNERAASAAIDRALALNWDLKTIYVDLMRNPIVLVGEMWDRGEISVAYEHKITQYTIQEMARVRREFRPDQPLGFRAVVTSVQGDQHIIGALMVADLLRQAGWEVDFLGVDTPAVDLTEFVRERKQDLVVLSVTSSESLGSLRTTVENLKTLDPPPTVIIGGRAVSSASDSTPDLWGADAIAGDALEAIVIARSLAVEVEGADSIADLLSRIGGRIRALRLDADMNQAELASGAGLDRTYIGAVERGRQNVTMAALLRLADALGVSIENLISK